MRMPRPSIMARIIPPKAPLTRTSFGPRLTASTPPVSAPAAMEFHGSSFFRIPTKMQSKVEKSPPHTAKLPPSLGLSLLMDSSAPFILAPGGEFFSPFTRYHTPPPTAPIPKALPQSSSILCGQGSLPWSTGPLAIAVGRLKKKKKKKTQRLFQASRPPAPSRPSRLSPSPFAHPLACLGARALVQDLLAAGLPPCLFCGCGCDSSRIEPPIVMEMLSNFSAQLLVWWWGGEERVNTGGHGG